MLITIQLLRQKHQHHVMTSDPSDVTRMTSSSKCERLRLLALRLETDQAPTASRDVTQWRCKVAAGRALSSGRDVMMT